MSTVTPVVDVLITAFVHSALWAGRPKPIKQAYNTLMTSLVTRVRGRIPIARMKPYLAIVASFGVLMARTLAVTVTVSKTASHSVPSTLCAFSIQEFHRSIALTAASSWPDV